MKIYSKNENYTGVSASVPFCNGRGETDDPYLIEWFRSHGYRVEEETVMEAEEEPVMEADVGKEAKTGPKKPTKAKGD